MEELIIKLLQLNCNITIDNLDPERPYKITLIIYSKTYKFTMMKTIDEQMFNHIHPDIKKILYREIYEAVQFQLNLYK